MSRSRLACSAGRRCARRPYRARHSVRLAAARTIEPGTVYPPLTTDETEARLLYDAPEGAADDIDVLALTTEMRDWIDRGAAQPWRLDDQAAFAVRHLRPRRRAAARRTTRSATYSAREAFDRRSGNCLAFTHLFIAMARELDLDAHYREIPGRPTLGNRRRVRRREPAHRRARQARRPCGLHGRFRRVRDRRRRAVRSIGDRRARARAALQQPGCARDHAGRVRPRVAAVEPRVADRPDCSRTCGPMSARRTCASVAIQSRKRRSCTRYGSTASR